MIDVAEFETTVRRLYEGIKAIVDSFGRYRSVVPGPWSENKEVRFKLEGQAEQLKWTIHQLSNVSSYSSNNGLTEATELVVEAEKKVQEAMSEYFIAVSHYKAVQYTWRQSPKETQDFLIKKRKEKENVT